MNTASLFSTFWLYSLIIFYWSNAGLAILQGKRAPLVPFFVRIEVGDSNVCGGSLIASNAVLTTANCLFNRDENRWAYFEEIFIYKSHFINSDWLDFAEWFSCDQYIVHQHFHPNSEFPSGYDIAVIKLERNFDLNHPGDAVIEICPVPFIIAEGLVAGMGLVSRKPAKPAKQLMATELVYNPYCSTRRYWFKYGVQLNQWRQLCYSDPRGRAFPCNGDSGSPLFAYDEMADANCLIGIESSSQFSCERRLPTVFIRVRYFADWIKRTIKRFSCPDKNEEQTL